VRTEQFSHRTFFPEWFAAGVELLNKPCINDARIGRTGPRSGHARAPQARKRTGAKRPHASEASTPRPPQPSSRRTQVTQRVKLMHMVHQETESKLWLGALAPLVRRLRTLGFTPHAPRRLETNQLYDFPDGRLRARGLLVRLRSCGGEQRLTFKEAARIRGGIKSRPEHETVLGDGAPLAALLAALGLKPTWYYEKYRRELKRGAVHLFVDETPIGNFLEIEASPAAIRKLAAALGHGPADLISDSYFTLYLKQLGGRRPGDMRFSRRRKT
jgi:adenylate cyclase class 2